MEMEKPFRNIKEKKGRVQNIVCSRLPFFLFRRFLGVRGDVYLYLFAYA